MNDANEVRDAVESLFAAILEKDVPAIQACYLQSDRLLIFLEGWEGKIDGFDHEANAAAWRGLLEQVTFSKIELTDDVRLGREGDLGWVGGTTSSTYTPAAGGPAVDVTQRATWVLERQAGNWVIVFEHVSFPQERPYGTNQLAT